MNDEAIFSEALSRIDPSERDHFLNDACGDDAEQRQRIEELLASHNQSDSFLDRDLTGGIDVLLGSTLDADRIAKSRDNQQFGSYRLLHLLGEGGMGSVYLAEQTQPVKRRVAVKVIKQSMHSDQFVARFEAERQALAMMDHPNIAKVLDAGCTDGGLPFFVMEFVKGIPITDFCDQNKLHTKERLQLFVQVCNAIQHAHQKGIIHRDLKPSNVMVALYDDQAVPKVIDFGVAKATHQQLTEQTLYTIPGQIVGTWEYMSPEQAILNQLDVDTRTDIYSLGVILYELLTGRTPLDLNSLGNGALEERLRRIREEEPSRPSMVVSGLGAESSSLAAYRGTEASALTQVLRGDLDWIVLRALEKDRSRRYDTASGFAAEIKRYFNDEPISFRPPSRLEQFGRFFRRNRGAVMSAMLLVGGLCIGLTFALWQYGIANRRAEILALKQAELTKANEVISDQTRLAKKTAEDLEERLNEVNDLLEEQVLHAALSGDDQQFRSAIERLRTIKGNERTVLHMQALFDITTGNANASLSTLQDAVRQDPRDLVALSILHFASERLLMDFDQMSEIRRPLEQCQPKSDFEQFLKTVALRDERLPELETMVHQRRAWTVGRALLADAQIESFLERGDSESLQRAIENIEHATVLAPEHALIRAVKLQVLTQQVIRFDASVPNLDGNATAEADALASELGSVESKYVYGLYVAADYWSAIGEYARAIPIWQRLIEEFDAKSARWLYNPLLMLTGNQTNLPASKMDPLFYVHKGDVNTAVSVCHHSDWATTLIGKAWKPIVFRLCGREYEAEEALQVIRDERLNEGLGYWVSGTARLVLGEITELEILDAAKGDRQQLAHAYFTLALHILSTEPSRRNDAKDYLMRAINLDIRPDDIAFWSLAMRNKLENDLDWPLSVRLR